MPSSFGWKCGVKITCVVLQCSMHVDLIQWYMIILNRVRKKIVILGKMI
jgi:hypothetical protein